MMMELFLTAEQAVKVDENLLGGKAKNLAWLSRQGLPVPRWWVLTTECFSQQLKALNIEEWVQQELAKLSSEDKTVANDVLPKWRRTFKKRLLSDRYCLKFSS
jgi:phosphoenolpyruvate synthase/pyruvate phosphate dikinase